MIKRKKKSPEEIAENKKNIEKRNNFFYSIWAKRAHRCENCDKWLGNEPKTYHFDHILEKQTYPELEFEEPNIQLLCFPCHEKKTNGYYSEYIMAQIQTVKTKFNIN